jgi:hypothetical protein
MFHYTVATRLKNKNKDVKESSLLKAMRLKFKKTLHQTWKSYNDLFWRSDTKCVIKHYDSHSQSKKFAMLNTKATSDHSVEFTASSEWF